MFVNYNIVVAIGVFCLVIGQSVNVNPNPNRNPNPDPDPNPNPNPNRNPDPNPNPNQVNDMVSEAISNFKGEIYYDGFVKILLAN